MMSDRRRPGGADSYSSRSPEGEYPAYPNPTEGGGFNLGDVFEILLKGKWIILACVVGIVGAVAFVTFQQAPQYVSASLVHVDVSNVTGRDFVSADVYQRKLANEFEIIKSSTMAETVARRIAADLNQLPEDGMLRNREDGTPLPEPMMAAIMRGMVNVVTHAAVADMFRISVRSTSPAEAAFVANLYAEAYQEYNIESSRARLVASREFLADATQEFQSELYSAENDLLGFLQREGAVAPSERANQLVGRMMALEATQFEAQTTMGMAEAELGEIQREIDRIKPGLSRQLTSSDDRLIDQLNVEINERIMRLEQRYAANPSLRENPGQDDEVRRIQSEINSFRRELDQRSARLLEDIVLAGGPDLDIVAAGGSATAARVNVLRTLRSRMLEKEVEKRMLAERNRLISAEVQTLRGQIGDLPDRQVLLNRLDRSQQIREQIYFNLVQQLQQTRIAERSELGTVNIVDRAFVSPVPVSPNVPRNLQIGLIFGLIMGVTLSFVRHAMDTKIRRPEDLKKKGFTVLGVIPDLKPVIKEDWKGVERVEVGRHLVNTGVVTLTSPLTAAAESYRSLRTKLQFARADRLVQVVVVTSANQGEGKSLTSSNLAVTMAEAGRRTVLIDADLRRPSVHQTFGLDRLPGLSEMLFESTRSKEAPSETKKLIEAIDSDNEAIRKQGAKLIANRFATDIDNLFVIPCGSKVPNPAEALGSPRMRRLLGLLREQFDVIIIDSPPVLAVADPVLLSTQADVTVIVATANSTDWPAMERATEEVESVGGYVGGHVLNRFDPKKAYSRYAYRYGYGYSHYKQSYYEETASEEETQRV
jgi:uncharacterized protein involved in exopolysaccharide biosynthesis/Mrp family chromosome partitioning ATPase